MVHNVSDLLNIADLDDDYEVWISGLVNFVSEYRAYIIAGEFVRHSPYKGDSRFQVDPSIMMECISAWKHAPCSYGIDFGCTDDGRTLLIETNEGFSLGNYGLQCVGYAHLLETRWAQLLETRK